MKQKQEKKNYILMRMFDGDEVLTTVELKPYHLTMMKHLITDVVENYSGGLTIWIDIQTKK